MSNPNPKVFQVLNFMDQCSPKALKAFRNAFQNIITRDSAKKGRSKAIIFLIKEAKSTLAGRDCLSIDSARESIGQFNKETIILCREAHLGVF